MWIPWLNSNQPSLLTNSPINIRKPLLKSNLKVITKLSRKTNSTISKFRYCELTRAASMKFSIPRISKEKPLMELVMPKNILSLSIRSSRRPSGRSNLMKMFWFVPIRRRVRLQSQNMLLLCAWRRNRGWYILLQLKPFPIRNTAPCWKNSRT